MKKGFTLIEMLAVVIILGILATVSISIVMNLIQESESGTFRDSGLSLLKIAKEAYLDYSGSDMVVDLSDNILVIDGVKTEETLQYNGSKGYSGQIHLTTDGKSSLIMYDGTYCAYKKESETDVTVFKTKDKTKCALNKIQ
jgi:prepilin-type N-terminal cleavage/methylation domain-containing protein